MTVLWSRLNSWPILPSGRASISVINKGDLEAAMNAPGKYPHVMVRLGGWTARFVDLDRFVQEEILNRVLY